MSALAAGVVAPTLEIVPVPAAEPEIPPAAAAIVKRRRSKVTVESVSVAPKKEEPEEEEEPYQEVVPEAEAGTPAAANLERLQKSSRRPASPAGVTPKR